MPEIIQNAKKITDYLYWFKLRIISSEFLQQDSDAVTNVGLLIQTKT